MRVQSTTASAIPGEWEEPITTLTLSVVQRSWDLRCIARGPCMLAHLCSCPRSGHGVGGVAGSHDATPSRKRGVFAGFDEYVSFEASLSSSGWRSRPAPILPGVRVDPGVTRSTPTVHQGPTGEAVGGPVVLNWCYLR